MKYSSVNLGNDCDYDVENECRLLNSLVIETSRALDWEQKVC